MVIYPVVKSTDFEKGTPRFSKTAPPFIKHDFGQVV